MYEYPRAFALEPWGLAILRRSRRWDLASFDHKVLKNSKKEALASKCMMSIICWSSSLGHFYCDDKGLLRMHVRLAALGCKGRKVTFMNTMAGGTGTYLLKKARAGQYLCTGMLRAQSDCILVGGTCRPQIVPSVLILPTFQTHHVMVKARAGNYSYIRVL